LAVNNCGKYQPIEWMAAINPIKKVESVSVETNNGIIVPNEAKLKPRP